MGYLLDLLIGTLRKFWVLRVMYHIPGVARSYHFLLAFLGALWYGFPSRKLTVIGVTGTKGKTTTCNLIWQILNSAGMKAGLVTTVNFAIGQETWVNDTKQTMPGRFALQRMLQEMVRARCRYAVVETSSEGILQHRHRLIDYRVAVFTNLFPEHIERHGSFEAYRAAKVKLFAQVARRADGIGVYNLDDENVGFFLEPGVATQYGYSFEKEEGGERSAEGGSASGGKEERKGEKGGEEGMGGIPDRFSILKRVKITDVNLEASTSTFTVDGTRFKVPLVGEFNVYNAAAAIAVARALCIAVQKIKETLKTVAPTPGRFEIIPNTKGITVIIDYAHEPASLEQVYKFISSQFLRRGRTYQPANLKTSKLICLLGAQGGGRDRWKRAAMGKIAAAYCDHIVLTNEDPYDEEPMGIIEDIEKGIRVNPRLPRAVSKGFDPRESTSIHKIIDRREAIQKALSLAKKGDVVILTGKGGEVWMCVEGGKKVPWNEREVVEEALEKIKRTNR